MTGMKISEIYLYPMKSARGIALPTADVDAMGLKGDRRVMLVDAAGRFVSQRELPDLARLTALPGASHLKLVLDDGRELMVAPPHPERRAEVQVWNSRLSAACAEESVNAVMSDWFGREVRLVFFDGAAERFASAEWAGADTPVGFADGYQVLVTTTASLAALNADMAAHGEGSVGMERFRPNIVIDCDEAWAEDRWAGIAIGDLVIDLVKPCARCIITTQDQQTGSREGASPMAAMGRIRMSADRRVRGPLFGWNGVPRGSGRIAIGDAVTVAAVRDEGWAIKQR